MALSFITLLLTCQLIGEVVTRFLDLPLPGPVIGMLILLTGLLIRGRLPAGLETTAQGLLQHLSLLFVPAGVGVVTHVGLMADEWLPITAALVVSVTVTIAVTALVMAWLARRLGSPAEGEALKADDDA